MWNFQDTFKKRKRSFISAFSICIAVPLNRDDGNPISKSMGQLPSQRWQKLTLHENETKTDVK